MLNDRVQKSFKPEKVQAAFKKSFSGPLGKLTLAWIADTCGATASTADDNPTTMAVAEGRRQVWLAIQDVLTMTEGDIRDLQSQVAGYGGHDE